MFNFAFGGGGPFGGGFGGGDDDEAEAPPSRGRKATNTTALYELLGVEKTATENEIKKAFRKLAMTHHPDKGGDPEKFKEISKAYEILSDSEKRQLYDQYGEEGVEHGGPTMGGATDIFDLFTGGGGRRGGGRTPQKKKGEDVVFPLKVELHDLYNGTTKKLRLSKNTLCEGCEGKGGKSVTVCKDCKGHGVRVVIRQLGPGMIQQMRTNCNTCNGTGQSIADKDKCLTCKGAKTMKTKKTLEVYINKGMKHGQKIIFKNEADESPDTIPGDVVVVLQAKPHPVFKRQNAHLFMTKSITLVEALVGFKFTIEHLDGRQLVVKSDPNVVYTPGSIKSIRDEGMPLQKNPYAFGNIYIEFKIDFPDTMTLKKKKAIAKLLPGNPFFVEEATAGGASEGGDASTENKDANMDGAGQADEVSLVDVDMEVERKQFSDEAQREAYDEDEEERKRGGGGGGGGGTECRAQ